MTDYEIIIHEYPAYVNLEQVRTILHISRRKAAWLVQNGFIKGSISDKRTHQYCIKRDDLVYYIKDSELHPEKYITPRAEFSAKKYDKSARARITNIVPGNLLKDFAKWLEIWLRDENEMLFKDDLIRLIGYHKNTINRWLLNGTMKRVELPDEFVTSKAWLIEFLCGYGNNIVDKSDKHFDLSKKYFTYMRL